MEAPPPSPVTVQVHLATPEQLSELLTFCSTHGLSYQLPAAVSFAPAVFDKQLRKPTAALKDLCGPEWLTPKGMISAAETYRFLRNYIRVHNLQAADGTIRLDIPLQNAFGAGVASVLLPHQLAELPEKLLT